MANTFVVGYDGTEGAKRALDYAKERSQKADAKLVVAYVLEWSPYSFLTPQEIEARHEQKEKELKRAKEHVIAPIQAELDAMNAEVVIKYGQIADTLVAISKDQDAAQIFVGRSGESFSHRVFGSTASKLAQVASIPTTIVP